ncbi:MAG: sel1 repeat family protein [Enterobacterales bacterium]|nr:sel1 repeat family protein [Enterobacterales bacterium]
MSKSHNKSNKLARQSALLIGLLVVCYSTLAADDSSVNTDWSSVVKISFTNPETGNAANCSGVLISPSTAITSASCILAEETGKQSRSARVCAERAVGKPCLESLEIMSHSGYLTTKTVASANNLAYLKLRGQFNLRQHKISLPKEITPQEFQKIVLEQGSMVKTFWVAYNNRGASSLPRNAFRGVIAPLEFDFAAQNLSYSGHTLKLGSHFAGSPVFIEHNNELKLIGLLSGISPDRTVHYYPEVNPCDLDPVIVRYPKEIMRYTAEVTPYAVSACGMQGFQTSTQFSALNCKRMQRALNLESNIKKDNPIALRQFAERLSKENSARDNIVTIYQNLKKAIASGDIRAREILAEIFLTGVLIPKDANSANQLLMDDSQQLISSYAHWLKAKELLRGYNDEDFRSLNDDIDKEVYGYLQVAAQSGYAEAQYYLGRMHQYGLATKPDNRKAYQWFAQAAMQGFSKAQFQLGTMWVDGRGVRAYPEVGLYWIRQAAARGYVKANNYLALNKGQYKIDSALNEYELEYNDT